MWSQFGQNTEEAEENDPNAQQNEGQEEGFDGFQGGWAQPAWATNNEKEQEDGEEEPESDWAAAAFQEALQQKNEIQHDSQKDQPIITQQQTHQEEPNTFNPWGGQDEQENDQEEETQDNQWSVQFTDNTKNDDKVETKLADEKVETPKKQEEELKKEQNSFNPFGDDNEVDVETQQENQWAVQFSNQNEELQTKSEQENINKTNMETVNKEEEPEQSVSNKEVQFNPFENQDQLEEVEEATKSPDWKCDLQFNKEEDLNTDQKQEQVQQLDEKQKEQSPQIQEKSPEKENQISAFGVEEQDKQETIVENQIKEEDVWAAGFTDGHNKDQNEKSDEKKAEEDNEWVEFPEENKDLIDQVQSLNTINQSPSEEGKQHLDSDEDQDFIKDQNVINDNYLSEINEKSSSPEIVKQTSPSKEEEQIQLSPKSQNQETLSPQEIQERLSPSQEQSNEKKEETEDIKVTTQLNPFGDEENEKDTSQMVEEKEIERIQEIENNQVQLDQEEKKQESDLPLNNVETINARNSEELSPQIEHEVQQEAKEKTNDEKEDFDEFSDPVQSQTELSNVIDNKDHDQQNQASENQEITVENVQNIPLEQEHSEEKEDEVEQENDWAWGFKNNDNDQENNEQKEEEYENKEEVQENEEDDFDEFEEAKPEIEEDNKEVPINENQQQNKQDDDDEEGFDEFKEASPQSSPPKIEEPKVVEKNNEEEEEDDFDEFEEAAPVQLSTNQDQTQSPVQQQESQKQPSPTLNTEQDDDEDDGFDEFEEPESVPQQQQQLNQIPQQIRQQSSTPVPHHKFEKRAKDPNKINTIHDQYHNNDELKDYLIDNLVKDTSFSNQEPANIQKYLLQKVDKTNNYNLSKTTYMLKNNNQSVQQSSKLDYLQNFDKYKDNNGKEFQLIGFKDFNINIQYDCSINDPTHKFALAKKNKQAVDILMSLKFSSDQEQGNLQDFESRIQKNEGSSWEQSIFRSKVASKLKIELPVQKKNKLEKAESSQMDRLTQLNREDSAVHQQEDLSPLGATQSKFYPRQDNRQSNMAAAAPNPVKSKQKGNFIDDQIGENEDMEDLDQQERRGNEPGQRTTTSYFSEEDEESKNDQYFQSKPQPQVKNPNADFVKDTFAKFGLGLNLYNPSGPGESEMNKQPEVDPLNKKVNDKLQKILDQIPDYGFLLDTKLALPQTFFLE